MEKVILMLLRTFLPFAALLLSLFAGPPLYAQTIGPESGLALPRFVSLRYDEVNLRRGPSEDNQVIAVYQRKGLPLEVLGEYRDWRRVRDYEGDTGWIKRTQLSSSKTAMVLHGPAALRRTASGEGRIIANMVEGLVLELRSCSEDWCKINVLGYSGYVDRTALWGGMDQEGG